MLHPDWLIGSKFRLRESDNLHTGYHQNSWISSSQNETAAGREGYSILGSQAANLLQFTCHATL